MNFFHLLQFANSNINSNKPINNSHRCFKASYQLRDSLRKQSTSSLFDNKGIVKDRLIYQFSEQLKKNIIIWKFKNNNFIQHTQIEKLDNYCTLPRIDILAHKKNCI